MIDYDAMEDINMLEVLDEFDHICGQQDRLWHLKRGAYAKKCLEKR